MSRVKQLFWALSLAVLITSCRGNKDYLVTIHTPYGDMKAVLYDETPQHKANFLKLAENGKYDSTIFHRVMENFMIQGGDINRNKPREEREDEYTIPAEFIPKFFHKKGALAAARQPDEVNPDRASSGNQFYIVQGTVYESEEALKVDQEKLGVAIRKLLEDSTQVEVKNRLTELYMEGRKTGNFDAYTAEVQSLIPLVKEKVTTDIYVEKTFSPERVEAYTTIGGAAHLDDEYTVFGQVVEGLDVVDKIAAVKTVQTVPAVEVYMTIEVEEVPKKELTKKYGIQYNE
ncbi:MAG: peptidylprolyl isomerase [Imperialibacter sp.]|uniref:peptidylprolyl isomerase n=1 Tax=Imperialibacter sp. TaxID=2038411 RepID=UPI0032F048D5